MKKIKFFYSILFGLLITCISIMPVFARAGGGHSFGGGSGGGFSSGGGSGGFFFLPFFFGGSGSFSSIIFALIIFFLVPYIIRRLSPQAQDYQEPYQTQYANTDVDLSVITNDDPGFSKERFVDRVQTAFFSIQKAWSIKDLTSVRGFMTDSMYQRLQMQIDDLNKRGVTNNLEEIAIGYVNIVKTSRDENYQSIDCAIYASMIDYETRDSDGKVVEGDKYKSSKFIEYWTFTRSNKAKTKSVDSLITKTCPNCGAPLDINEFGKCKYCQAYVISGDFDWVLSDISQQLV